MNLRELRVPDKQIRQPRTIRDHPRLRRMGRSVLATFVPLACAILIGGCSPKQSIVPSNTVPAPTLSTSQTEELRNILRKLAVFALGVIKTNEDLEELKGDLESIRVRREIYREFALDTIDAWKKTGLTEEMKKKVGEIELGLESQYTKLSKISEDLTRLLENAISSNNESLKLLEGYEEIINKALKTDTPVPQKILDGCLELMKELIERELIGDKLSKLCRKEQLANSAYEQGVDALADKLNE